MGTRFDRYQSWYYPICTTRLGTSRLGTTTFGTTTFGTTTFGTTRHDKYYQSA